MESAAVFRFTPETLEEMAAWQCGLICWRDQINKSITDRIWGHQWLKEHIFKCSDCMLITVEFCRSLVDQKIRLLGKELGKWMISHLFLGVISPKAVVNSIVLNSDGSICHKRTAKNLLTMNSAFSSKELFRVACKYCFEEDIERLWSSVKNDAEFNEYTFDIVSRRIQTMDYWCSKMRSELQEFYGSDEARSPEWHVLSHRMYINNWVEVEYFWKKLKYDERSSLYDILLDRNFVKHMVFKLDIEVLEELVKYKPNLIIRNLAEEKQNYEFVLQLWNYVKNLIVDSPSLFYDILLDLSKMAFCRPSEYEYDSHVATLLKEIWISAPATFKNHVSSSNFRVGCLFEKSVKSLHTCLFNRDVGFLIEILKDASFRVRQRVWRSWWRKLIMIADVSKLIEFIDLCFDEQNDIAEFKKNSMLDYEAMDDIFEKFIEGGFFDELAEYLKFCCSDDDDKKLVRDIRKKLVYRSIDRVIQCDSDYTVRKFFRFFDGSFTLPDLVEVLECEIVDKEAGMLLLCILFDEGNLNIFNKILICLELPEQRLIELKQFFYQRCYQVLTSGDFESFFVRDWESFLMWCDSTKKQLDYLKQYIPTDTSVYRFRFREQKFFG